ncbi:polysaccharide lyase family protein [Ferruginibacter sp.]
MKYKIVAAVWFFLLHHCMMAQKVQLLDKGETVQLSNGIISLGFNKTNADITEIINHKKISLLGKKGRAYLLAPDFNMSPSRFTIVRLTDSLIELSFFHDASNHFQYDLHYILRSGDAGVYCFLEETHRAGDSTGDYGQTRWGIRADENLFDYHLVRDSIQGPMPKMAELKDPIQDWTYRLPDSTYYTKYDYADYIEDRYVHGMAGQKSGLGIFVINPSHEYLNGGPTKQYQDVHSDPFLINMFNCGHFLSDVRKGDNKIDGDWRKLNGPFFLFITEGKDIAAIWKTAKQRAVTEKAQWPYKWMQHADYPLLRGQASGQLMINGQPAAPGTHIVLADKGYDWQAQSRGYIYYTKTNSEGKFVVNNIRPGKYSLYAYGSNQTEEFVKNNVSISADIVTVMGKLKWEPKNNGEKLWQIGIADRKTTGFKLADSKRNYAVFLQPPAELNYTIGTSKENNDWYYAQTKEGNWNILFTNNKTYTDSATLTIAVAGCARNPQLDVVVNGTVISSLRMGNDASVYRSAIAGGYYQLKELKFPAALLQTGENKITLNLRSVKLGAGIMYDAIKLEAKQ